MSGESEALTRRSQPPRGSIYVEVQVEKRIALSRIVEHWTKDEAAALVRGDKEARTALIDEAHQLALRDPDESEVIVSEISITAEVAHG